MKYSLLILLFSISIYSQNSKQADSQAEKTKAYDAEDLDKEFYTYYYMNLPKYLQQDEKDKKKLNTNIIRILKKEILKRDRQASKEEVNEIKINDVKIKKVFEDSPWIKLIKKEMKYVQFTDFMYIAKYKKYLVFVIFVLDPEKHLITPSQVEYLKAEITQPIDIDN